jgi:hypothetical protein
MPDDKSVEEIRKEILVDQAGIRESAFTKTREWTCPKCGVVVRYSYRGYGKVTEHSKSHFYQQDMESAVERSYINRGVLSPRMKAELAQLEEQLETPFHEQKKRLFDFKNFGRNLETSRQEVVAVPKPQKLSSLATGSKTYVPKSMIELKKRHDFEKGYKIRPDNRRSALSTLLITLGILFILFLVVAYVIDVAVVGHI